MYFNQGNRPLAASKKRQEASSQLQNNKILKKRLNHK